MGGLSNDCKLRGPELWGGSPGDNDHYTNHIKSYLTEFAGETLYFLVNCLDRDRPSWESKSVVWEGIVFRILVSQVLEEPRVEALGFVRPRKMNEEGKIIKAFLRINCPYKSSRASVDIEPIHSSYIASLNSLCYQALGVGYLSRLPTDDKLTPEELDMVYRDRIP